MPDPHTPDVEVIADPRLEGLWGQNLVVAGHTIELPDCDEPFLVPAEAAAVLLQQPGWRRAPPKLSEAPRIELPVDVVPLPYTSQDTEAAQTTLEDTELPQEAAKLEPLADTSHQFVPYKQRKKGHHP